MVADTYIFVAREHPLVFVLLVRNSKNNTLGSGPENERLSFTESTWSISIS